jgi:hypothetical protein
MLIRIGYDLTFRHYDYITLILMLEVHPSRAGDLHIWMSRRLFQHCRWIAITTISATVAAGSSRRQATSVYFQKQ